MRRHASHMDLPAREMDKKQHVIRHETGLRPDFGSEEVRRHEHIHVRANELLPRGRRFTFWSRWNAMAFQDVPDGLVTDRVSEVRQGANDPIIAPGAILPRHTHDQGLQLWINRGAPWGLALPGTIKLLGDQLAVPAENGVRLDERGHFLQSLLAELLADLGEGLPLAIIQPDASFKLVAQDAILRHQVLVTQQQFLIDGPGDIRQQMFPVHCSSPAVFTADFRRAKLAHIAHINLSVYKGYSYFL
jgi:hypothetical protein